MREEEELQGVIKERKPGGRKKQTPGWVRDPRYQEEYEVSKNRLASAKYVEDEP